MGQHSTFVGKGLLAPSTGVGLWGVCISILDFFILFIFTLLFIVFLLFLFLLLFLTCSGTVLVFTFSCARQKIRLSQNLQKQNNSQDNNSKWKIHTYLHFGFVVAPATSLQPPPAVSGVMWGNWREYPAEQSAAAGGAIPHWAAPPSLCSWAALTLSWDLPPHSTDTQPGTGGHIAPLTDGLEKLMLRLAFIPHLTSYFAKKLYFIGVYRFVKIFVKILLKVKYAWILFTFLLRYNCIFMIQLYIVSSRHGLKVKDNFSLYGAVLFRKMFSLWCPANIDFNSLCVYVTSVTVQNKSRYKDSN